MGIIFEEICAKVQADPKYRPAKIEVQRFKEELEGEKDASIAEGYKKHWASPETRHQPILIDVIQLPPDWAKKKVTPRKVNWYLAQGWTINQIAKELSTIPSAAPLQEPWHE